jgi:cytochrome c-type biogenesis protein CcmE
VELPGRALELLARVSTPLPGAAAAAWGALGILAAPFVARRRSRLRRALRIGAGVVVLALAGAALGQSSRPRAPLYVGVDELADRRAALGDHPLKVHGWVEDGSIERVPGTSRLWFVLRDASHARAVRATYDGLLPDTFRDGSEVIVSASLTPDADLEVVHDGVIAKCPRPRCVY